MSETNIGTRMVCQQGKLWTVILFAGYAEMFFFFKDRL